MKPAIRKDRHSGNIPTLVRTQHQHRSADILLGIPDITQGNGLAETTAEFRVSLLLCDVGGAQSGWSDAIDPNAKSAPFPRGRSRQPTNRFLGAVIITEQRLAIDTLQRTEINDPSVRSEEHTSELQSLMRISYAVFCLKKKKKKTIKKL